MKYVYILLICLILFYILSRYFEKYYSQENFDPSLVPVSSIITLAKVAQKIVDGNGTLTNPANLNIGTTSARGNLLVTGNSTTNGNKQIDGTLGVTGATTLSNTLGVAGNTTVGGTLGVTGATTVGGTLGITGATTLSGTLGVTGATTLNTLGVTGNTKIDGDVILTSHTLSTDSTKAYFLVKNKAGATSLSVGQAGDTFITSNTTIGSAAAPANLNVTGTLTIGGITLSNVGGQLKISTGINAQGAISSTGAISSGGTITATGIRNGGGFQINGPGIATNGNDYSSIIRDSYGRMYAIDGLYGGSTGFGKAGAGTCDYNNASNCIGPGKTAGNI